MYSKALVLTSAAMGKKETCNPNATYIPKQQQWRQQRRQQQRQQQTADCFFVVSSWDIRGKPRLYLL
jgi:hypothetical protein